MTTEVPKSEADLREMVYHTDARVTAMESQLQYIGTEVGGLASKFDQFITQATAPKHINWAAWVGVGISFLVMLVTGLYGFSQYVALVNEPQIQEIRYNRDQMADYREFQSKTHYEFGGFHKSVEVGEIEIERLWEHIHALEDEDDAIRGLTSELSAGAAAAKVSRAAVGDYAREVSERVQRLSEVVANFQAQAQFIHGQRAEMSKRLDDVDNQGSRRWNADKKGAP